MSDFTAVVPTHLVLDTVAYRLWLAGLGAEQVVDLLQQRRAESGQTAREIPPLRALATHVLVQFRNFDMLEPYLQRPRFLSRQLVFPLGQETKAFLIETYYSFDAAVIREVIGKKLSSRERKDLDEVAERTQTPLGACRRMFDNFRRILKHAEDAEGNIVKIIQNEFCLKTAQAQQYAHLVFMISHRLDTRHRKLEFMQLADFEYITSLFFICLTTAPYNTAQSAAVDEFDPTIARDAQLARNLLSGSRELLEALRVGVVQYMRSHASAHGLSAPAEPLTRSLKSLSASARLPGLSSQPALGATGSPPSGPLGDVDAGERTANPLDQTALTPAVFRGLLRAVFSICAGIRHSKAVRRIFLQIYERVVESVAAPPLRWDERALGLFFQAVVHCWVRLFTGFSNGKPVNVTTASLAAAVPASAPPSDPEKQRLDQSLWRICTALKCASQRMMLAVKRAPPGSGGALMRAERPAPSGPVPAVSQSAHPSGVTSLRPLPLPASMGVSFLSEHSVQSHRSAPVIGRLSGDPASFSDGSSTSECDSPPARSLTNV